MVSVPPPRLSGGSGGSGSSTNASYDELLRTALLYGIGSVAAGRFYQFDREGDMVWVGGDATTRITGEVRL